MWEVLDSSGAVAGSVKGRALTKVAREGSPMDGGFGSVDSVLYVTYDAEGEPALRSPIPIQCKQLAKHSNLEVEHFTRTVPKLWLCTADRLGKNIRQGLRCSAALLVISSDNTSDASQLIAGCVGRDESAGTCRIPLAA